MFSTLWELLFENRRNVIRETAEVFRVNSEQAAVRAHDLQGAALAQFAAEFTGQRSGFDRFMDGVNRLPRPMLALGTLGLMVAAMVDPLWFAARMQGVALVPEPLWWLLGIVVSFYFGARSQAKTQAFQEGIARSLARVPQAVENIEQLKTVAQSSDNKRKNEISDNPALVEWHQNRGA
ncbi:holin family protein [Tritonibacter mobilis]|uniref:holin family protein n=1 Tax=Tritonibacter mobilis TaxID=379347 RepID=UPI00140330DA|nr:holin family protein [Tritonibacter mobilis]NHM20902.1 carboxylesterase [Tritonibacter mobilis]NHM25056.1 carboxylesterase [Tritonibacter mobilis]